MKFTMFRNLIAGGGSLLVVGLLIYSCSGSNTTNTPSQQKNLTGASGHGNSAANPKKGSTPTTQEIMQAFDAPSGGKNKAKDVFFGSTVKVNMYDDNATGKWMRAKIDYNRDEKDDEKWTRNPDTGKVTRVLAISGTENFGPEQTWDGTTFVP